MDFSEIYLQKIAEQNKILKSKSMPLLSWDVFLQNYTQTKENQKDLLFLKRLLKKSKIDVDVIDEFVTNKLVIIITDLELNIEFATNNMMFMNGYQSKEVIGKTPKLFQGPKTNPEVSKGIRKKVAQNQKFEYTLINYRKDKSLYNCHIKGFPVYNAEGSVIKYIALEKLVA